MTSQKYPTTTISYSKEDEARRLLYVMVKISRQWYQNHGFLILPYLPPGSPTNVVHIPNLPYTSIANHWKQLAKLKLETPIIAPETLITEYVQLLDKVWIEKTYLDKLENLQKQWNLENKDFWHHLFTLFPGYTQRIKNIHIHLTQYGPGSTFNLAKTEGSDITIYLRLDQSLDKLYQAILFTLFRPTMEARKYAWEEIESVVDFLMQDSSIAHKVIFTHPVIPSLRQNQHAKWQQDAASFLASLGLPTINLWSSSNQQIYYGEQKIIGLTLRQQLLVEKFIVKPTKTLTYDEIATVLWPKGEDFSLWAIVKEIARIRKVCRNNNIHLSVLHAHRKIGYTLR